MAEIDAEGEKFLADLEKEAEEVKFKWMSARVPESLRDAFSAKYAEPEPAPPPDPITTSQPQSTSGMQHD